MGHGREGAFRPDVNTLVSLGIRGSTRADLRLAEKAVLQSIASRLGPDGIAWTNYPTIARDAGTTKSVVADVVRYLRKVGVLFVEGETARRPLMGFSVVLEVLEGPAGEPRKRERAGKDAGEAEPPSGSREAQGWTAERLTVDRPAVQGGEGREGEGDEAWTAERDSLDRPAVQGGEGENQAWTAERLTVDRPAVQGAPSGGPAGRFSLSDHDQEKEEEKTEREAAASKPRPSRRARGAPVGGGSPLQGALFVVGGEVDSGEVSKSRRRKPKTSLPEGFAPSQEMRQWAISKANAAGVAWTMADVDEETEKFCTRARAADVQWVDWKAAWENWIRQGIKYAWKSDATAPRTGGPGPRRVVGVQPAGDDSSSPRVARDDSAVSASSGGCYL